MTESNGLPRRGRPPLPDTERRQQIGVRTSPSLKANLENAAARNGRSVAQEAELRLVQSFEHENQMGGEQTGHFLRVLAAEIELIERATKKRWHKDLKTFGSVAEMLKEGPLRRFRPDNPYDDDVVRTAWDELDAIRRRKSEICADLVAQGIPSFVEPYKPKVRKGLFGSSANIQMPPRSMEFRALEQAELPDDQRDLLRQLIEQLVTLDVEFEAADKKYGDAIRPYIDAENEGRELYRSLTRRRAQDMIAQGDYSYIAELY